MAEVKAGCKPHFLVQEAPEKTKFTIMVTNSVTPTPALPYKTYVPKGGILLGALKRLHFTTDFQFTYMEFQDYGPYLNSVNGLFEDRDKHTYWQLESQKPGEKPVPLKVGIGCYIPNENEEIILNYTKYRD